MNQLIPSAKERCGPRRDHPFRLLSWQLPYHQPPWRKQHVSLRNWVQVRERGVPSFSRKTRIEAKRGEMIEEVTSKGGLFTHYKVYSSGGSDGVFHLIRKKERKKRKGSRREAGPEKGGGVSPPTSSPFQEPQSLQSLGRTLLFPKEKKESTVVRYATSAKRVDLRGLSDPRKRKPRDRDRLIPRFFPPPVHSPCTALRSSCRQSPPRARRCPRRRWRRGGRCGCAGSRRRCRRTERELWGGRDG